MVHDSPMDVVIVLYSVTLKTVLSSPKAVDYICTYKQSAKTCELV